MKLFGPIIALFLLIGTVAALPLPQVPLLTGSGGSDLKAIASFEGGQRYQAGPYPVIVLTGSFRQMGRQYGGLMKAELNEEYAFLVRNLSERGYTQEQVRAMGHDVQKFMPERMKEISRGMAETSGLTEDDTYALYYGPIMYMMLQKTAPACSFLAAWGPYTRDGSVILSRNYDLTDAVAPFDPYYVLVIYRPSDGSNGVATFGFAGVRPETLMNEKGLFIADNNAGSSGGSLSMDNRPDLISEFLRLMLDYSDLTGLDAGIQSTRTNLGWIVNAAGPEQAFSYEEAIYDIRQRKGDGVIAAANHFVDPGWHYADAPPEHSLSRYNNLLRQAEAAKGSIDPQAMMQIRNILITDGGATFKHSDMGGSPYSSDHQVVFVPKTLSLFIKVVDKDWQNVELAPLFSG
jgi:hypothetical protein